METGRLEALRDGVIATIIPIRVLDPNVPQGAKQSDLSPRLQTFLHDVPSFIDVRIHRNPHHRMLNAAPRINGRILWGNPYFLFRRSVFLFVTAWIRSPHFCAVLTSIYGVTGLAYLLLEMARETCNGRDWTLATAVGKDFSGRISARLRALAIPLAFLNQWISDSIYVLVAALWFIPDRRIEKAMAK